MAKIRKRGNSYQIDYIDPNGNRVRKSFSKKKEAEAELGKRVSLIAENRYLDVKKDYKTTLTELLDKYKENYRDQSSFKTGKVYFLENFRSHFGEETKLANIKYVDLETYKNHLKKKLTPHGTIRADSSINREMSCLHHIFSKAFEWEMMEQNPFDRGKSLILKENNKRLRFLTEEEIQRLLVECPKHLCRVVECAINTGMRRGEILNLRWDQIRDGFIYLRKTKTNEAREIPVNDTLEEVFKEIKKEQQLKSRHVFTYQPNEHKRKKSMLSEKLVALQIGRTFRRVDTAFKAALKRASIEDFKFHDLRHTFASQMIMHGASLKEVQELLGHKDIKMTMRYAHLSQEHKKKAVNLLSGLTAPKNP
ncbi:MAG: tyrosine-type recombinase/integrase, partial [Candidatus Thorarchaeota archaeon]